MNLIAFLSFSILIITILTLVFGVIAYFLYKARENKKSAKTANYKEMTEELGTEYIFITDPVRLSD